VWIYNSTTGRSMKGSI